jgi:hypothetical protein
MPTDDKSKVRGFFTALLGRKSAAASQMTQVEESDAMTDGLSISMLLGAGKVLARNRQQIYIKRMEMVSDPIISTALRLHVTAALGGHETSSDVVYVEASAKFKEDKAKQKIVDQIRDDLSSLFNRIANTVAFNAGGFGDAYGRVYNDGKNGVVDVYVDELVHPSVVTAYERANTTLGFVVATGQKATERLDLMQMARMKMPRMVYIPQIRAMEKAIRQSLKEDDINKLPLMPSLIGGSFLDGAEKPFDDLSSALVGLVGQRVLDSIDESMLTVNMDSMTKDQRKDFMTNLKAILIASKKRAEQAVASGKPVLSRIYNILPTWGEKQLTAINGSLAGGGRGQSGSISIEDVMFHAKILSGALGIDLSMLGFADLLSGGLGEGGFFRSSAQAAERSRMLRIGLTEFFNQIIDIHTYHKWGMVFLPNERPWMINFYGTISALETERQRTKLDASNNAAIAVQTFQMLRDLRMDDKAKHEFMTKIMLLDEDQAKLFVAGIPNAPEEMPGAGFGGGGGFGDGKFGIEGNNASAPGTIQ